MGYCRDMETVRWEDSGRGHSDISLAEVAVLAIETGHVFPDSEGLPDQKRANLNGASIRSSSGGIPKNYISSSCPLPLSTHHHPLPPNSFLLGLRSHLALCLSPPLELPPPYSRRTAQD